MAKKAKKTKKVNPQQREQRRLEKKAAATRRQWEEDRRLTEADATQDAPPSSPFTPALPPRTNTTLVIQEQLSEQEIKARALRRYKKKWKAKSLAQLSGELVNLQTQAIETTLSVDALIDEKKAFLQAQIEKKQIEQQSQENSRAQKKRGASTQLAIKNHLDEITHQLQLLCANYGTLPGHESWTWRHSHGGYYLDSPKFNTESSTYILTCVNSSSQQSRLHFLMAVLKHQGVTLEVKHENNRANRTLSLSYHLNKLNVKCLGVNRPSPIARCYSGETNVSRLIESNMEAALRIDEPDHASHTMTSHEEQYLPFFARVYRHDLNKNYDSLYAFIGGTSQQIDKYLNQTRRHSHQSTIILLDTANQELTFYGKQCANEQRPVEAIMWHLLEHAPYPEINTIQSTNPMLLFIEHYHLIENHDTRRYKPSRAPDREPEIILHYDPARQPACEHQHPNRETTEFPAPEDVVTSTLRC